MFDNGSYLRRRRRFKKKDAARDKDDRDRQINGMDDRHLSGLDDVCKSEGKSLHGSTMHDHDLHNGVMPDCNGSIGRNSSASEDSRRDSLVMNGASPSACLSPPAMMNGSGSVTSSGSAPSSGDTGGSSGMCPPDRKPILTNLTTPKLEPLDAQHCMSDNSRPSHLSMSTDHHQQPPPPSHNTDGPSFTVDNIITTSMHSSGPLSEYASHLSSGGGGSTSLHPVRDHTPHNISSSYGSRSAHNSDPYRTTTSSADSSPSSTLNYHCNAQQSAFPDSRHGGQSMNIASGGVLNDNDLMSAAAAAAQPGSQHHYAPRTNWYSSSMSGPASSLGELSSSHGPSPGSNTADLGAYSAGYDAAGVPGVPGVPGQSCQLAFRTPYKNNSPYHPYADCSKY